MTFAEFTRPDGTPVSVNVATIIKVAPVPAEGPSVGPLRKGTRIYFTNKEHQDVKELHKAVHQKLAQGD